MNAPVALRPYQRQALLAMEEAHRNHRRILVSLPTGTGKTLVAGHYLKTAFFDRGDSILWIAHTEELLDQTYATLTDVLGIPEEMVVRRYAGRDESEDKPVARIWLINNAGRTGPAPPHLIVVDEAHHAAASTYTDWLSKYRAYRDDGARVLGLTATPYRLHEGEVTELLAFGFSRPAVPIFQHLAFRRSFCELATDGYVAPFRQLRFETNMNFKMRLAATGDVAGECLESLNTKPRNQFIHRTWRENREKFGKTLIFVGTQDHARDLARVFGDDADYVVSGDMPRDERRDVIQGFRDGDFPVLINVGIFKEGVDVQDIRTVILARPTASPVLFTQMVGRGSRVLPNKKFFYLVDIHDQLGAFEGYLMGVEDLADRADEGLIDEIERKAAAAERAESSDVGALDRDARVVLDLLASDGKQILVDFAGWIAFETAAGEPAPVAALLDRASLTLLRQVAGSDGVLLPGSASALADRAGGAPGEALRRCVRALKEGLRGRIYEFQDGDDVALEALRESAGGSAADAGEVSRARGVAERLEAWGRGLGMAESRVGALIDEATGSKTPFAAALGLIDAEGKPFGRLLSRAENAIVGSYVERSRAGGLGFSDALEIMRALEALDPGWAPIGQRVVDPIVRAGRGEVVTVEL